MQNPTLKLSESIRIRKIKGIASVFTSIVGTIGLANSDRRNSKTQGVRKGHIAMYVGLHDSKRYEVPVDYLNLLAFQELIKIANDGVLDTKIDGPIEIRCTTEMFDSVLLDCAKESLDQRPAPAPL